MIEQYTDQFTPAFLECDLSYDGLPIGDRGCIMEHLAPLSNEFWNLCHSDVAVMERILLVDKAIKKAATIGEQ